MRQAFARTLAELADKDQRILLLTADLGYLALEPFSEKFPDRFLNVGVAEQNMVGMATGLAEAGFLPFVYSIVTFATLRPYEFIRNGPVMQHLPVRIVGVGGGLEYGQNGVSHHGLEDLAVMRLQPGLSVIAPADHEQARAALSLTWDSPGPIYYRLSKDDKTTVPGLDGRFELGRAQVVCDGEDLLIVTVGSISAEVVAAAEKLKGQGINCTVMVVSTVTPAPVPDLVEALSRFPVAITVESHYIVGGIGSLVSEVVAEHGLRCRIARCGVKIKSSRVGSQSYLHRIHGLTSAAIAETAVKELRRTGTYAASLT